MTTVDVRLADIKPYEKNQKKHDDTQVNNIAISIDKYGFVQPLVLDKDNNIIIGHGRYLAAETPDVAVQIIGSHSCMTARGIKNTEARTTTRKFLGVYKKSYDLQKMIE